MSTYPRTEVAAKTAKPKRTLAHIPQPGNERLSLCGVTLKGPRTTGTSGQCVVCWHMARPDRFLDR